MRAIYEKNIETLSIGDSFNYSGPELHHLKNVARLKIGEEVVIINGSGLLVYCNCIEISKKNILLQVARRVTQVNKNRECIISLIKRESLELAIRSAVEMGVVKVHIVKSDYSQNYKLNTERLNKIISSAMIQSNNAFLCDVEIYEDLEEVIKYFDSNILAFDNGLDHQLEGKDRSHFFETDPIVCIGPEGGFSSRERILFNNYGIKSHAFETPILRAETAVVAALSYRYL